MENPEQAFVDYASSRIDEAGGKWYAFKPEQNNLDDTYNLSWKSHPNLSWVLRFQLWSILWSFLKFNGVDAFDDVVLISPFFFCLVNIRFVWLLGTYCDNGRYIYNAIKADIDFSVSFADSDDEDYTFICDKDLFSYKLIPINDLKPEAINDHVEINNELCSENVDIKLMDNVVYISNNTTQVEYDKEQRHQYLRFKGLEYIDADIANFEERMLIEPRDAHGQSVFTSRAWRRLFEVRCPLVHELILEFFSTFRFGDAVLNLDTASTAERSQAPVMVTVTDLSYLMGINVASVNIPYLLARYLCRFALVRKPG
nr:MAK10-like protein [Tanacetum cinerariifolium]